MEVFHSFPIPILFHINSASLIFCCTSEVQHAAKQVKLCFQAFNFYNVYLLFTVHAGTAHVIFCATPVPCLRGRLTASDGSILYAFVRVDRTPSFKGWDHATARPATWPKTRGSQRSSSLMVVAHNYYITRSTIYNIYIYNHHSIKMYAAMPQYLMLYEALVI